LAYHGLIWGWDNVSTADKKGLIRPTIRAIADMAGVSRTTVSLILANRQDMIARFRTETVAKVRQAAESLGYRANLLALSLRSPRPSFFGLVLRGPGHGDPGSVWWHNQAFEGMFLAGALDASRALRLHPVVATQDLPDPQEALVVCREVLDGGVFGAVIRSPTPVISDMLRGQIQRNMPVVMVFPDTYSNCPTNSIDLDNVETGRIAGQLLYAAGHRRWLVVIEQEAWAALRVRLQAVMQFAEEAGAPVTVIELPPTITIDEASSWLPPRLRDIRPDGIYSPSPFSAVCALHGCQGAGLRIPDDACLVGSDAAFVNAPGCPRVTSVDVSWFEAGELAVRKMDELRTRGESVFESVLLKPLVHPGATCPTPTAETT
jgi:LacI family transcriptional regulator